MSRLNEWWEKIFPEAILFLRSILPTKDKSGCVLPTSLILSLSLAPPKFSDDSCCNTNADKASAISVIGVLQYVRERENGREDSSPFACILRTRFLLNFSLMSSVFSAPSKLLAQWWSRDALVNMALVFISEKLSQRLLEITVPQCRTVLEQRVTVRLILPVERIERIGSEPRQHNTLTARTSLCWAAVFIMDTHFSSSGAPGAPVLRLVTPGGAISSNKVVISEALDKMGESKPWVYSWSVKKLPKNL